MEPPFDPLEARLLETDRPDEVSASIEALRARGVPYRLGLLPGDPPRVLFTVPEDRLQDAREALAAGTPRPAPAPGPDEDASDQESEAQPPADVWRTFPWGAVATAASLVLAHLAILVAVLAPFPPGRALIDLGALVEGRVLAEPWRLLTSLVLHADLTHVLANGVSMVVFAVPLLVALGRPRTLLLYLASGAGGGIAAAAFARPGAVVLGSSGAVAGLFGAWAVLTYRATRGTPLLLRSRVRILGIALLMLPSLLSPTTASGKPVAVGAHLGGMATGMLVGALVSRGLLGRRRSPEPPGEN